MVNYTLKFRRKRSRKQKKYNTVLLMEKGINEIKRYINKAEIRFSDQTLFS
jgi:hypothetical protein